MDLLYFIFVCTGSALVGAIFFGFRKIVLCAPEKMFLISFVCVLVFVLAVEYFISGKIDLAWREIFKNFAIALSFAFGTYIGVIINFLWRLGSAREN